MGTKGEREKKGGKGSNVGNNSVRGQSRRDPKNVSNLETDEEEKRKSEKRKTGITELQVRRTKLSKQSWMPAALRIVESPPTSLWGRSTLLHMMNHLKIRMKKNQTARPGPQALQAKGPRDILRQQLYANAVWSCRSGFGALRQMHSSAQKSQEITEN